MTVQELLSPYKTPDGFEMEDAELIFNPIAGVLVQGLKLVMPTPAESCMHGSEFTITARKIIAPRAVMREWYQRFSNIERLPHAHMWLVVPGRSEKVMLSNCLLLELRSNVNDNSSGLTLCDGAVLVSYGISVVDAVKIGGYEMESTEFDCTQTLVVGDQCDEPTVVQVPPT